MPLVADYEHHLESTVADADNAPKHAGAITAALFLQHFVGGVPWAHLDVASVGDSPGDRHEWSQGPTGFGVRLLLRWLTGPEPLRRHVVRGADRPVVARGRPRRGGRGAAAYVDESSHARFTDMRGLRFKTWRMRPGPVVRGLLRLRQRRGALGLPAHLRQGAGESPGSKIIGSAPVLIEECDIVAMAEGQDGFRAASRF